MARDTPPKRPIGVGPDGQLPLPWLGDALAQSLALAGAHALLIHGPAGVGHLEFGLLLAQAALCEAPGAAASGQPCGRCASCHLVTVRSHPDLRTVMPAALRVTLDWIDEEDYLPPKGEAKPSREIRVEQIRMAIDWSQQTSGRGRGKVLLLHPADAMNGPAANALLKTLEEPPGTMRLLLTSADPERLLPTVRSRCQRLRLALPPGADALAWLQAQGLADAAALLAAAGGSPLEALAWAQEGLSPALLAALPRRVAAGDASPLIGRPLPRVIELLLKLAHDAQVLAAGGAPRFFAAAHLPANTDIDTAALRQWQHALLRAARHDEHPWNAGLLIESLVSQAKSVWPGAGARPGPRAGASLHSGR